MLEIKSGDTVSIKQIENTPGFDGHSLRAAKYFDLPVDINDPKSVNTIVELFPDERDQSKAPTFALTYQGTWVTIMKNCGFSEAKSKKIEKEYHILYTVSDQWLADQLQLCCKQGYITVAFGLRIRTPLLAKSVLNTSKTLRESQAEARTVGNAIAGQSYGLLNNRAAIDFMNRVWASEYKYDIFLVSMIHDAIYIIFRDDIDVVTWINENLPDAMAFQDLPEIDHPDVKLRGAKFGIHHPTWAQEVSLPNNATPTEILDICKASKK